MRHTPDKTSTTLFINNNTRVVVAFISIALCALPCRAQQSPRSIIVDSSNLVGKRDMFWQQCVGADHPGILLRKDNLEQLRMAHNELGFKYIRFHGIFTDDMEAYREENGRPIYNFDKIDAVYDALVRIGMKPFVELSFMPNDLASDHKTIFHWKGNVTPPRDFGKWADFITAFVRHLESHFGKAEVESWKFEVWNEPNLEAFWAGGGQDGYFHLYDTTSKAIKAVDAQLEVGGPATAGAAWVPQFIEHAKSAGIAVDFITTHTYGVEGGFLDEKGQQDNKLSPNPGSVVDDVVRVRQQINASGMPNLPLHFTEWSTSYNPRDPVHDSYISAAFILEKLKKTQGVAQSMSYWTYTDLFEEVGPPPASFHGGFGLINREGIRKASFFAYKYLNELGTGQLKDKDAESWFTADKGTVAGLIWNYTIPEQKESDRPFFRKLLPAAKLPVINLLVTSMKPGKYRMVLHRTGFDANDAYSQYVRWNLPTDLTHDQIETLQRLSNDQPEMAVDVEVGADGKFQREITMRTNDVLLVKLSPAN